MKRDFSFKTVARDNKTKARVGVISTPHGDIQTPAFVPCGTQATVKSLTPDELNTLGVQLYFVNTYHMYLRPGVEVVKKMGGLHTFMGWDKPLITDSGGFQVFSLARDTFKGSTLQGGKVPPKGSIKPDQAEQKQSLVKITDDGVEFRSHWDGSKHMFTAETSMAWQWDLGADMHIAFDDCTPYPSTHEQAKISMERTHRWAVRSLEAHRRLSFRPPSRKPERKIEIPDQARDDKKTPYQALYGSIQGSVFEDLRVASAKYISSMDFDGFAIGGVAVGESKKEMVDVMGWVTPFLPPGKPRHLLGVGEVDDIFALVEQGIDTFDCVQPTRLARVGWLMVGKHLAKKYSIDITKAQFARDEDPVDPDCGCYACTHFSRGYIHHLFHVKELLGYRLATIHNLYFIHRLVLEIRKSIENGLFLELKRKWL